MRWSTPSVPASTPSTRLGHDEGSRVRRRYPPVRHRGMEARERGRVGTRVRATQASAAAGARRTGARARRRRRRGSRSAGSGVPLRWRGRPKFDFHSGRLTHDVKKDEQEDRDTIVACGAARRRQQRRPDVVLDSTPRRSKAASGSLPSRRWRKARRAQGSRRRPTGLCAWRARRRSSYPRRRHRPRRCWTGSRATRSSRIPGPVVVAGGGGGFCDVLCFEYECFAIC